MRSYGIRPEVDQKIRELIDLAGEEPNKDLINELITTVLKFYRDRASRGDLKLVNTALKEMRYSILVFARHFDPKVTIFGSARIPAGDPNYLLAEEIQLTDLGESLPAELVYGAPSRRLRPSAPTG